jgi:hypothetical protein
VNSGTTGFPKGVAFNVDRGFQGGAGVTEPIPSRVSERPNAN